MEGKKLAKYSNKAKTAKGEMNSMFKLMSKSDRISTIVLVSINAFAYIITFILDSSQYQDTLDVIVPIVLNIDVFFLLYQGIRNSSPSLVAFYGALIGFFFAIFNFIAGLSFFIIGLFLSGFVRERKNRKLSKEFYIISIAVLNGFIILSMIITSNRGTISTGDAIGVIILLIIPVVVLMMSLIYKMWASIQDGYARTTPKKAILLFFIPFYNIYWVFQAFWGFSKDYNKYVQRYSINAPQMPEGLFLAFTVLNFTTSIPDIGTYLLVVNYFVGLVMIAKICDGVNAIFDMKLLEGSNKSDTDQRTAIFSQNENDVHNQWNLPSSSNEEDYVRRCLETEFQDALEIRTFRSDPAFSNVLTPLNSREYEKAIKAGKQLLSKFSDFDLVYTWIASAYRETHQLENSKEILSDGLKKAKRKYFILTEMGEAEWQSGNIEAALYCWSQALHCLSNNPKDYNTYLLLSYVAKGVGLVEFEQVLLSRVDALHGGQIRLDSQTANRLIALVRNKKTEAMEKVLHGLKMKYFVESSKN